MTTHPLTLAAARRAETPVERAIRLADAQHETNTPDGDDCTVYFEHDWQDTSEPGVYGERYMPRCEAFLRAVVVKHEDGSETLMDNDDAHNRFGLKWVRAEEKWSQEVAEND